LAFINIQLLTANEVFYELITRWVTEVSLPVVL